MIATQRTAHGPCGFCHRQDVLEDDITCQPCYVRLHGHERPPRRYWLPRPVVSLVRETARFLCCVVVS